jgi:putative DNA primase/helicase
MTVLQADRIPAELRTRPQWVAWRYETRDEKQTKVLYVPGTRQGVRAKSNDPATWGSYDAAVASLTWAEGIGYVFSEDDPYAGVDLDDCRDPDTGRLEQHAAAVVLLLDSYTEASPSGRGVHVLVHATISGDRRRNGKVEMYDRLRFFTITGEQIHGKPGTIEERQAELDALYAELFPPAPPAVRQPLNGASPIADDRDLIEKAHTAGNGHRFAALWDGAWEGAYSSQSEADAALCSMLAFWTDGEHDRIDRLFRMSGLYRPKWERADYRAGTLAFAIANRAVYSPTRNVGPTLTPLTDSKNSFTRKHLDERSSSGGDVSGGRCDLAEVLRVFDELLYLPDHGTVLVALAGIVANYAMGDPVWPLLVGPPGCGKSEIISALTAAPGVWSLSSLTPQTLLSGFERKGTPASMLLQIGEFGILAFKDLTTVLTMHREARAQIVGQLREVADGRTEKSFGNGLRVEWEGKLGLVAGVTPVIDDQQQFLAVMGERFLLYRMPAVSRTDITRRALSRRAGEPELRERIRRTAATFLEQYRDVGRLDLPDKFTEPLIGLADIVTRARSGVARDGYTRELLYLPLPEAPTRLAKQVAQLAAAMLKIGVSEAEAWRLAHKIGWDSVPAVRCQVIELLSRCAAAVTYSDLQEQTGLPETTVKRVVEDLHVLGLAKRWKDANRWLVEQSTLAVDYWAGETSGR